MESDPAKCYTPAMTVNHKTAWPRWEILAVAALCSVAAGRMLLFSSAFPLFNSTDEPYHYDTVMKYAQWELPDSQTMERESAREIVIFGSPEYYYSPESFGGRYFRPIWTVPENVAGSLGKLQNVVMLKINSEVTQPPLYYALAAVWYHLGHLLGVPEGADIYWIRLMNIPAYILFMLVAYLGMRYFFRDRRDLRLSMAALLAFLPQDVFYGINNDALSPLLFGSSYLALMALLKNKAVGWWYYAAAGLLTSACILTKFTNAGILVVLAAVAFKNANWSRRAYPDRRSVGSISALALACLIPIALWAAHAHSVFGDFTGVGLKLRQTGWTLKPWAERWRHPLFGISGVILYWSDLASRYWRGEYLWHGQPRITLMDPVYSISSFLFLGFSLRGYYVSRKYKMPSMEGNMCIAALASFVTSILLLVYWSISYDFGSGLYPSRAFPYVTSGRLIIGTLLPFLFLYVDGIERLFKALRIPSGSVIFVTVLAAGMCVAEASSSAEILQSPYNLFHLRKEIASVRSSPVFCPPIARSTYFVCSEN